MSRDSENIICPELSLVAQMVNNLPAVQETWIWSLDQEGLLVKGMAITVLISHNDLFIQNDTEFSPVQFSSSVVSDSLRPHESQHARPPCPSPAPGVHPNPCSLTLNYLFPYLIILDMFYWAEYPISAYDN